MHIRNRNPYGTATGAAGWPGGFPKRKGNQESAASGGHAWMQRWYTCLHMEKNDNKSFVKGAVILGVAGLICKIIGAFFRIPLYNMLGDGMQFYEAVYPFYSTLVTISTAGLPTAISRMVAERATIGDYKGAKNVFRRAQLLLFIFGLGTAGLMFGLADVLAMWTVGPGAAPSFRAMAPALFFVGLLSAYRGYLQGMQKMTGTAVSQVVEQVGTLLIGLILAKRLLPYGLEYGTMGAIIGVTASELIALAVMAGFYLKNRKAFLPPDQTAPILKKKIIHDLLAIAIPVTIGGSIISITGMVDASVIKRTLIATGVPEDIAAMSYVCFRTNVASILNLPAVLTVALAMSLVPAISAARTRRDRREMESAIRMGIKISTFIGMPCMVGLYVLAQPSLDLLYNIDSTRLQIATALMKTSSISVLFLALTQTLTGILQGIGKHNIPVVNLAIGAAVKIVSMIILLRIPSIGIQGAAISNVLCYLVSGVLDYVFLIRYAHVRIDWIGTYLKPGLSALCMGAVAALVYTVLFNLHPSNTICAAGAIGAAVVTYLALIFLSGMFDRSELMFIPGGRRFLSRIDHRETEDPR